ncbi:hypothetical protein HFP15_30005 [Amycolatopsis sp. K13G38]|uniref:Copper chaperone PCu(A)C n=1 Tax=Amycolatopsis acididurans TaxID=2724524 RepID=A0ABX1JBQ8_9PSEU|nr:hypothetical protein [Amycolatopsis acididurans]NKQ57113.1 hypothetical protein [Amycolatopsis acididurans]
MRLQKRRVLGTSVLGLGAALVLAGCGAGQITQTDTMLPAVNGALASAGKVSVRNAGIVNRDTCDQAYAAGSNAPLALTIANDGSADDELVSVTSPNAASATIGGQKTIVAASKLVVGPANGTESASEPTSTSASTQPSAGASSRIGHGTIELQGLKSVVWPGMLVPVTFTFRTAGPLTVQLPVNAPTKALSCGAAQSSTGAGH